ncbi:menaquinone biosynthetic enzyme MqnA/MqnD family protein [Pontiella sulfatireligans]|uniref:Chorismate dehydratase n=1 Tax=Pontiella sulfatireligans TaxID=2750658 RepID=A0A6C2UHM0_9BACT|nr:menaquinone biosynthesis protein [Pontiella sulfatireligans]VGO19695.1 Chorismate dehydratase [Pontiella sulfatireligans]
MKNEFIFAGAPYSNSAPLVDKLTEVDPRVRVFNDHPASLVRDLKAGRADVALIPVAHLFAHPELTMLKGLGVAADGPVRSVLLKCNKRMGHIKTVGRDPASATSNALAELLLKKHFKQKIEMHDFQSLENPDAAVVIGDRALCADPGPAGDIDLAEAWKKMTGLPFVFAVWAVRSDFPDIEAVTDIVHQAYAAGFQAMEEIAERFAGKLGGTTIFWLDYLDHSIHYKLDKQDLEGLNLFKKELSTSIKY